jgi:hypothetical protein
METTMKKATCITAAAVIGLAATFGTALAGSANRGAVKRVQPAAQQSVQMSRPKLQLQGNGGATEARECTWTNEGIAECTEWIGDTIVFTCFDKYGNSIGC